MILPSPPRPCLYREWEIYRLYYSDQSAAMDQTVFSLFLLIWAILSGKIYHGKISITLKISLVVTECQGLFFRNFEKLPFYFLWVGGTGDTGDGRRAEGNEEIILVLINLNILSLNFDINSDSLSHSQISLSDAARKIKQEDKPFETFFFPKQNREARLTKQEKRNCSSCYQMMEEIVIFRMKQLRNFGRQSNRLKSRNVTLGKLSVGGRRDLISLYLCLLQWTK